MIVIPLVKLSLRRSLCYEFKNSFFIFLLISKTTKITTMSMSKEFKEFIVRGNVMDLAVGIVIGAAFAKIVDAMVKDILMPILGLVTGPKGFTNSYISLSKDVDAAKAVNPNLSLEDASKIGNVLAWG